MILCELCWDEAARRQAQFHLCTAGEKDSFAFCGPLVDCLVYAQSIAKVLADFMRSLEGSVEATSKAPIELTKDDGA